MNVKAYFRGLSSTVIILNIVIVISAIFLVERIVPAIDEILQENAYTVSAAISMLNAISSVQASTSADEQQLMFWNAFEKAKANITLSDEKPVISEIQVKAKEFWQTPTNDVTKTDLSMLISKLAELNLQAMEKKDQQAQFLGLTGAWALGFLLIISVGIQLLLRMKILDSLIDPIERLYLVLDDFSSGKKMRRFTVQNTMVVDIKKIGTLVNKLLDRVTPNETSNSVNITEK